MVFEDIDARAEAGWQRQHGLIVSDDESLHLGVPSGYRVVVVDTESAAELRDLASLRRDLELAVVYAESFSEHVTRSESLLSSRDPFVGLWYSALISYGRAFSTGVRHDGRILLDVLGAQETKSHEYFLDLRNKHVAHSVNGYEDTVVIAYLTDSAFVPRQVTRTGQVHTELLFNPETAPLELRDLCLKHIEGLNGRIQRLHIHVARELWELGMEDTYALPDVSFVGDAEVGRSRKARPGRNRKIQGK